MGKFLENYLLRFWRIYEGVIGFLCFRLDIGLVNGVNLFLCFYERDSKVGGRGVGVVFSIFIYEVFLWV